MPTITIYATATPQQILQAVRAAIPHGLERQRFDCLVHGLEHRVGTVLRIAECFDVVAVPARHLDASGRPACGNKAAGEFVVEAARHVTCEACRLLVAPLLAVVN